MRVFVAFASVALLAAPAFAQGGSGTVSGSAAELASQNETNETDATQPSNGERVICRRVQNDSSTRRTNARRICRTPSQWREAQRAR